MVRSASFGFLTAAAIAAASCASPRAGIPARPVAAGFSGEDLGTAETPAPADLLDRAEALRARAIAAEAERAIAEREDAFAIRSRTAEVLREAERRLGEERLALARSRRDALDVEDGLEAVRSAIELLRSSSGNAGDSKEALAEAEDLERELIRIQAVLSGEAGVLPPADAFRGRLELSGLLLRAGRADEAADQLRSALRQVGAERASAARTRAIGEASRDLEGSLSALAGDFEERKLDAAGEKVAELIERLRSLPGGGRGPAESSRGRPGGDFGGEELDEAVRAIESGDFARAEAAAAASGVPGARLEAIRERIHALRDAAEGR